MRFRIVVSEPTKVMSSLIQTIENDLRESLRARDEVRTATLRMLKNNLKNTSIARRVAETEFKDSDVIAVVRQELKKRKESIEAFEKGGRPELADKEKAELVILQSYVPASISNEEIRAVISDLVMEKKLTPPYQFGALMGQVVKKIEGRAEGQAVKKAVEEFIAGTS